MAREKKLIIGNWKMNLDTHEASLYAHALEKKIQVHRDVEVVIAPTMLSLQTLSVQVDHRKLKLAAQNIYWRDHGAYTGEVSASQLRGVVQYALIGHSERRHIFFESDKDIRAKVQAAIRNHIKPVLCVGETAQERSDGETEAVLHDQLVGGLANITSEELSQLSVAYEPVWAIGTGDNALPRDVQKAVKSIRSQLAHLFGKKASEQVAVLYGGSVSETSAGSYLDTDGVDGLLVGGASLHERQFIEIIKIAHRPSTVQEKGKTL